MLKLWEGVICYKHGKWVCVIDVECGALMWHVCRRDVVWSLSGFHITYSRTAVIYYNIFVLSNAFQELMAIKCRQTGPGGCEVHPCHVMHGSEQPDLPVHPTVSLHTLKQLLSIVENLQS